jgi:hypothetical protein
MFKVKNLGTIALSVFAVTFLYQVFTKAFTSQGGDFKKYAEESQAGARRVEEAFAKSRVATESLSTDSSASEENSSVSEAEPSESTSFHFPQSSCGDKPTEGDDNWYPVFIDGADLESIRANYCADAVATKRKDTGVDTVQLASLTSHERALELAQAVNGDVGEPTITQANSNDEPSQQPNVEVNPTEQTTLEAQIQQQQAEQKIIQAASLCHKQYIGSKEATTQLNAGVSGYQENFVADYINDITKIMDDMGEAELQECLAKAQQQR